MVQQIKLLLLFHWETGFAMEWRSIVLVFVKSYVISLTLREPLSNFFSWDANEDYANDSKADTHTFYRVSKCPSTCWSCQLVQQIKLLFLFDGETGFAMECRSIVLVFVNSFVISLTLREPLPNFFSWDANEYYELSGMRFKPHDTAMSCTTQPI